ncbi:hypothetical protein [Kocuria dechangensis]|nr:hypothetical protein [Kocuria dechangensis]
MDDRTIARTQARLMRTAMSKAGLGTHELWLRYAHLGGEIGELELDAYLHHALYLSPRHRDCLARAANQLAPGSGVPCSRDLRPEEFPPDG